MTGTLCALCAKRLATITINEVDSSQQSHSLSCCHHCLERLGVQLQAPAPSITHILALNDDGAGKGAKTQDPNAIAELGDETADDLARSCPDCGLTWAEFLQRNRFGCARDVDIFADLLQTPLMELHGADNHSAITLDRNSKAAQRSAQYQRLQSLRRELAAAVAAEAFEKAAELRDKLRQLEGLEDS